MEPVFLSGALVVVVLVAYRSARGRTAQGGPRPGPARAPARAQEPAPFDPATAEAPARPRIVKGRAWVTDGDTIRIGKTQIRLFGIDAPELDHPFGQKAKWALYHLCKDQKIRAEITETDHYGRTVAKCYLADGTDLSAEMVKRGLALDWAKHSGGCYRALERGDARRRLFLADARQRGRMDIWRSWEAQNRGP